MEIAQDIDVFENSLLRFDKGILRVLLSDKSTGKNIVWATTDYCKFGEGYEEYSQITANLITGGHSLLILPRITKSQNEKDYRTRSKAKVFTPSWTWNWQNHLIDAEWFGCSDVFISESVNSLTVNDIGENL